MPAPDARPTSPTAPVAPMTGAERLLAAVRRQPVDRTPVWFMRQAGRCLPEYRELRKRYDLITMAKSPDLCCQVTLMPVERFGVDGAVLFADIMFPLTAMGVSFDIQPEVGPIIHHPIRTPDDVARLRIVDGEEGTPFVMAAIRVIHKELQGRAAMIGFAGAPFTLACYMVEGRPSREYAKVKGLMYSDERSWHALMEKVTEQLIRYLRAQVDAGIEVAQLFDSWVGILSPQDYARYVLPYAQRIFEALRGAVSTIHFGTGNASFLDLMAAAGPDAVSVDWRVPLDVAWDRIGHEKAIQGNLDPVLLLAPWERLEQGVREILQRAAGRPGHIFNLGHGVLPQTNPDQIARVVQTVHQAPA